MRRRLQSYQELNKSLFILCWFGSWETEYWGVKYDLFISVSYCYIIFTKHIIVNKNDKTVLKTVLNTVHDGRKIYKKLYKYIKQNNCIHHL